ncbi:hypothetical protein [uncultured Roseobacter sp.]|uniref:hypothetical protein n=1 Tax=uncultured Roseobacter sp. TaxID=114847 RepID=UPI002609CC36|nr:hypothetical protein [uncultured Roseobacter sp.]
MNLKTLATFMGAIVLLGLSVFPGHPAVPWFTIFAYALCAYILMPDLATASSREIIEWHFVYPLVSSVLVTAGLLQLNPAAGPALISLGAALFGAFLMGTLAAFTAHAILAVVCNKKAQDTFRAQPFASLVLLFAVTTIASQFVNLAMANSY